MDASQTAPNAVKRPTARQPRRAPRVLQTRFSFVGAVFFFRLQPAPHPPPRRTLPAQIRALCWSPLGLLVASRDCTASLWTFDVATGEYVRAATFAGHDGFVTAIGWAPEGADSPAAVVTGSRDATVRLWLPTEGIELARGVGHRYQVSAVAVGRGFVASASLDSTVRVWSRARLEPLAVLSGHSGAVNSLALLPSGDLASGSSDGTIRRWSAKPADGVGAPGSSGALGGLAGPVDEDDPVGRSGSSTLGLAPAPLLDPASFAWVSTTAAHADTVRSLRWVPGLGLLSGGHDGAVKLWGCPGEAALAAPASAARDPGASPAEPLRPLWSQSAHRTLIYGVAGAAVDGVATVATASEDGTAKVFRLASPAAPGGPPGGELLPPQTLAHGGTVWDVAVSAASAALATAASDRVARVFDTPGGLRRAAVLAAEVSGRASPADAAGPSSSAAPPAPGELAVREARERHAAWEAAVSAHEAAKAAEKAQHEQAQAQAAGSSAAPPTAASSLDALRRRLPPGLTLHPADVLERPGAKDGATVVVPRGGGASAYSWDAAAGKWELIGDVVDGPGDGADAGAGAGGEQVWDRELDVDVEEGKPHLKLRFNNGEDAHQVADRFMAEHALPSSYREQIANFVAENGGSLYAATSTTFVDPYTGASAYTPPPPVQTAGGAGAKASAGLATPQQVPPTEPLLFDAPPPREAAAARAKDALRSVVVEEGARDVDGALIAAAVDALVESACVPARPLAPGAPPSKLLPSPTPEALATLGEVLRAKGALLVPGLDLARRLALSRAGSTYLAELQSLPAALDAAAAPDAPKAALTAALRLLTNAAAVPTLRARAFELAPKALEAAQGQDAWRSTPKAARVAAAALLRNLAADAVPGPRPEGWTVDRAAESIAVYAAGLVSGAPKEESEAIHRGLVALGTAALVSPAVRGAFGATLLSTVQTTPELGGAASDAKREVLDILRMPAPGK